MVTLLINGQEHQLEVPHDMPLLWVLGDIVGLTGTKFGCGVALCGACTVHLDGRAIRSCITPVVSAVGKNLTTIEAVGETPSGRRCSTPGSLLKSFSGAIANLARSCRQQRCWRPIRTPAMRILTRRCPVIFAVAAPISVFAPLSNGQHRLLEFRPVRKLAMDPEERLSERIIPRVPRRAFLRASVAFGGGLLLGFSAFEPGHGAPATGKATPDVFVPNAFIRIGHDGQVTLVMPQVEMGQGTYTSLSMLIAEELEITLDQVTLEAAPPDDQLYANPLIGAQVTGGSTSVRAMWQPLRGAGAAARAMLIAAAAQRWHVDPSSCHADNGEVIHMPTGRRLSYGALAEMAARLPVPQDVPLKDPKQFKLIGTPAKRLDTPDKVNGRAQFGIDVQIPGMKIAAVAACPVFGGKLAGVDDSAAMAVEGVHQVVRLDDAVAVVADHMWAALQGLAALDIDWKEGPNARVSISDIVRQMATASQQPGVVARKEGDVANAMAGAATKIEAVYQSPFLGACCDGADELHGPRPRRRLRCVGRQSSHHARPVHCCRGDWSAT